MFQARTRSQWILLVLLWAHAAVVSATVVRLDIDYGAQPAGSIYIELFDSDAPATVANFLGYVSNANGDRRYDGTLVHRSAPGFVIQGGGYRYDPGLGAFGQASAPHIDEDPPVANEFDAARSNVRGTIAMAKLAGDPDSATSEWFINLADNSAVLDPQNGGFTVFGRVLGAGMAVVDAIAGLDVVNQGGAFASLPVIDAANPVTAGNLVTVRQVVVNPPSTLSVSVADNDFGLVALNSGPASLQLTLLNSGDQDLVLGAIGNVDALAPPFSLPAGGDNCSGQTLASLATCTFAVEFEPSVSGEALESFNVPSSDAVQPELTINLRGTGVPETPVLDVAPSGTLDFGNTGTGEPRTLAVTVRNYGGGQLEPLQPVITGADAGAFTVAADDCTGAMLNIGDSCSLSVRLLSLSVTSVSAVLSVSANPGGQMVQLSLGGNIIRLEPVIGLPVSLTLDDTEAGSTGSGLLTISNSGVDDLFVSDIGLAGVDAALYSVGADCINTAIAPSSSCSEPISFTSGQTGLFSATLRVTSNDPAHPVIDIPLSATASEDGDGVPDAIERAGPHGGDGNLDGIQDSAQARVTSLPDINGQFITLEAGSGLVLSGVRAIDSPSPATTPVASGGSLDFRHGFFSFTLENVPAGGAATLTLYLPDGQSANSYYKYGRLPGEPAFLVSQHWYDFTYNPQNLTGAEFSANRVTLHFVDGGRGDNDQLANGRIVDPGGPGEFTLASGSSGGGGCSISSGVARARAGLPIDLLVLLLAPVLFRLASACIRGRAHS